jgi:hypothetical protein
MMPYAEKIIWKTLKKNTWLCGQIHKTCKTKWEYFMIRCNWESVYDSNGYTYNGTSHWNHKIQIPLLANIRSKKIITRFHCTHPT